MPRLGRALAVSVFVLGMILLPIDGAGASAARPAEAAPRVPHFTDVTTAADHGHFTRDLYYHQTKAADYLRARRNDPNPAGA